MPKKQLAGVRGITFRSQKSQTLAIWREEIREEIKLLRQMEYDALHDGHSGEAEAYHLRWRRMCGQIARITCILRDRWFE